LALSTALALVTASLLCQQFAHGIIRVAFNIFFIGPSWLLKTVVTVLGAFAGVFWIRVF
jgi:hypothetical protein